MACKTSPSKPSTNYRKMAPIGTIYSYPNNPRVARALIAAKYNGFTVDLVDVELGKTNTTKEYTSKFGTEVPAFESVDGFHLTGANAIAQYIASAKPGSTLCGSSLKEAALIQQWIALVDGELAPAQAAWLFPLLGWTKEDPQAKKKAIEDTKRVLKAINDYLLSHTYLAGEFVTLADITVAVGLLNFYRMVFDAKFRAEFKNVNRWFNTVVHAPEFADVLGEVTFA
ncbi:glutathione S-transferase [Chytriomyces sp. MP71]|nr:glutathione S-transferase [Chytriomyces sp. MP71]